MKVILMLVISLVSFNVQANECSTTFGAEIYPIFCANCHDAMPATIVPKFELGDRLDKTDDELITTILEGKGMMPPWAIQNWTDEQLNEIICYLRSLQEAE